MEATEGRIVKPGVVEHAAPNMEGLKCEVQWGTDHGEFTDQQGTLAFGVIILPTGQPRVLVQLKHADGRSLGAIMHDAGDAACALSCFMDAAQEAQRIADAADAAKAKPQ